MLPPAPTYQFTPAVEKLQRSILRELLKHAVDPALISLAGGLPAAEALPVAELEACLHTVLARDGAKALQYAPPYMPLKTWIAEYMRSRGVECTEENVFITNGNQQGLSILSRLFLDHTSTAVIDEVVFTGVQQITGGIGAHLLTLPSSGYDEDVLEHAFARQPQLAVLIPDFHNPLGTSLTLAQRQFIAELAARYQVPLVEDDPYSALRFTGQMLPPLRAFDESGFVFYLGSFSKMVAPALRLGWMIVPQELVAKVTVVRESLDLESSTLTQRAAAEFLYSGALPAHLARLCALNRERCTALMQALDTHLSDVAHWIVPEGGLFTWVTLPANVNTWELFHPALAQGVVYVPGGAFSVTGGHTNTLRLNFSSVPAVQMDTAIQRLAQVIKASL